MAALRFDRQLYAGEAVDEAVKAFARFADFELSEDEDAWVVACTAKNPKNQARIAGELGNYALGLTIQRGGPDA